MIVKVMIKREIQPGMEADFFDQLKLLRSNALLQEGYISGETLLCTQDPARVMVISKWDSLEHWEAWKTNPAREEIERTLTHLQKAPAVIESYVFSKYRAAATLAFPPPLQRLRV